MNKRLIKCPFGLLNIGGLMKSKPIMSSTDATKMIGYEITTPLFCHETYKVKPTFNRNLNRDFAIMISDDDSLDGKYY